jgi:hypothetical protein
MSTLTPQQAATLAAALDPEAQARAATAEQEQAAQARAEALLRAAQPEAHPQLEITKLFMRCGPRARREFLQDVKHIEPQLFAEIAEGAQ